MFFISKEDRDIPIIFDGSILTIVRTLIEMGKSELILMVKDEQEVFNLQTSTKVLLELEECNCVDEDDLSVQKKLFEEKTKIWSNYW